MSPSLVLGLLAAILLFWSVGAYNRLVRLRSVAAASFAPMDEQLSLYFTLVQGRLSTPAVGASNALATLHGASQQFEASLKVARQKPLDVPTLRALAAAHATLLAAWLRLSNEPPDLAGAPLPEQFLAEWQHATQLSDAARAVFNQRVGDYNHAIAQFPASLLARVMQLRPAHAF